ncbi:ribosome maturation factor RimM [Sphingomonas sp. BN140010]|uniref:Ribosome maturation factor RimM n=1 Tax=Sphingomonas arvum TaxID=2992113 RepID=A0ABT3JD84_9SPHN|nr:ribosome maturation factor RimM [Sphingomonas sp. BN140010]MCW3797034.1 ribosome maturation factor RimM [Sphingomonas sp. BN140010]
MSKVALAAIAGAHGIRGEVRLKLFTDSADNLAHHSAVTVGGRELRLEKVGGAGKAVVARFAGVTSREAAEAMRGQLIEVDRAALPALDEGEYYHADLIGLPCFDQDGAPLGTVVAVENFGAGDLLEIEGEGGKRALVPFTPGVADLTDGRVVLDPDFLA